MFRHYTSVEMQWCRYPWVNYGMNWFLSTQTLVWAAHLLDVLRKAPLIRGTTFFDSLSVWHVHRRRAVTRRASFRKTQCLEKRCFALCAECGYICETKSDLYRYNNVITWGKNERKVVPLRKGQIQIHWPPAWLLLKNNKAHVAWQLSRYQ